MRYFTIGDPEIYDIALLNGSSIYKSGIKKDYIGEIVFATKKEAEQYATSFHYKVYELITDINNIYIPEGKCSLHLIDKAQIKHLK